jgi:hypothetical protein
MVEVTPQELRIMRGARRRSESGGRLRLRQKTRCSSGQRPVTHRALGGLAWRIEMSLEDGLTPTGQTRRSALPIGRPSLSRRTTSLSFSDCG